MRIATILMAVALANLGGAHADTLKPPIGYERVGMLMGEKSRVALERDAQPTRLGAAPGESPDAGMSDYPARKREMARRLVWLMLSAR